jgi:hypothetical protein
MAPTLVSTLFLFCAPGRAEQEQSAVDVQVNGKVFGSAAVEVTAYYLGPAGPTSAVASGGELGCAGRRGVSLMRDRRHLGLRARRSRSFGAGETFG